MTNDSEAAAKFAAEHSLAVTAHLFQAGIPKAADVRVTVVGERVFAQQVTAPDGALDWRRSGWDTLGHAPVQVPGTVTLFRFTRSPAPTPPAARSRRW
nr:hypothetical protein [Streptomyces albofaciens]